MSSGRLSRKKGGSLPAVRRRTLAMPGPRPGQSLCGRLRHRSLEQGADRARSDHHASADAPAPPLLVQRWLARLLEHPRAGLSKACAKGQTGASSVGRPRDAHVDANRQASPCAWATTVGGDPRRAGTRRGASRDGACRTTQCGLASCGSML